MHIEFVGGPFDGHEMALTVTPADLASTVALPVNENVFSMLEGQVIGPAKPCRTVALYELHGRDEGRYFFLGSRRATDLNLQNWQV